MDQRSGDGRVGGLSKFIALNSRLYSFSKLRDAGREDCVCSEQDHPELLLQEEGYSRGAESSIARSISSRTADCFMINDYFRVTGAHNTVLDYVDLFRIALRNDAGQGHGVPKACHPQAVRDPRGSRPCVCATTSAKKWHMQGVRAN